MDINNKLEINYLIPQTILKKRKLNDGFMSEMVNNSD
jgi:hypothetical protein